MTDLIQIFVRGLGQGSVYALLAVGFVIIYKATKVISFAQPGFMMAGAVLVTYLVEPLGFFVALPVAALATAGLALGVERVAIRPMVGRPAFTVAIITIGVDVVVRVATGWFVPEARQVGDPWGISSVTVLGADVRQRDLAILVTTTLVMAALFAFFRFSRTGLAMRAAAYDQEAALAQGVSVGAVFATSWGMAGALAAIAGAFAPETGTVDHILWVTALVALPVIILGGLDSLFGAVVAGLVIGLVQQLVAHYEHEFPAWLADSGLPSWLLDYQWLLNSISQIIPYLVMTIVLLVRPYGLFGTKEVTRV